MRSLWMNQILHLGSLLSLVISKHLVTSCKLLHKPLNETFLAPSFHIHYLMVSWVFSNMNDSVSLYTQRFQSQGLVHHNMGDLCRNLQQILEPQTNSVGSTFFWVVSPADDQSPDLTNLEHLGSNRNTEYSAVSELFTKPTALCTRSW